MTDERISPFASAWLAAWQRLGHSASPAGLVRNHFVRGDALPIGEGELEPHLVIWTAQERVGATRALEALLEAVPGGAEAVRELTGEPEAQAA